jgi:hypothetical protein
VKLPAGDEEIYIGSASDKQFLNGLLDEVRIWDRVLSAEEVQKLYARESANLKGDK